MKKMIIKSRGFSLLEVIFVLAFLGILLLAVGNYARKLIDERARQAAADAVAQEVYGALQFINAGSITATINKVTKKIINPLYQQPADPISEDPADINSLGIQKNPLWLAHPGSSAEASSQNVSPYIARSWSKSVTTPVSNGSPVTDHNTGNTYFSHSLKWSQTIWGANSVRGYFTDSGCAGASGNIYFNQQFLSCNENPVLRGSEIAISRLDLVSDQGTVSRLPGTTAGVPVGIDRVDVYVSFSPVDNNPARIEQFITPLMTAFRLKKITPNTNGVYLVRELNHAGNTWTLLDKTSGQPATAATPDSHLALFSDLPDMTDKLQRGQTYAIRFSFDGKGDYLRTDGLNSADKVCWNTKTGAGPCLTSPSPDALVLKQRQNSSEFANLQVGDVISKRSYLGADGKSKVDEYYTVPLIQYAAFHNTGQKLGPYYKIGKQMCTAPDHCIDGPDPSLVTDTANGAISVPLQTCPTVVNGEKGEKVKTVPMHPRLSAAVSSVVSGITKDDGPEGKVFSSSQMVPDIFKNQKDTMTKLSDSNVTLNRLGGAVLQVNKDDASHTWRIAGMVASEDVKNTGNAWIYFNPSWLSVMITTWCSSVDQP
ncbi:prepilin-type N-terminal cleavage/methylation domain-containing protein [Salmonella enterica]|nr:prepilin-type N-terminal cleavage/methylation domain-containing protein [Salmonella enterica]